MSCIARHEAVSVESSNPIVGERVGEKVSARSVCHTGKRKPAGKCPFYVAISFFWLEAGSAGVKLESPSWPQPAES